MSKKASKTSASKKAAREPAAGKKKAKSSKKSAKKPRSAAGTAAAPKRPAKKSPAKKSPAKKAAVKKATKAKPTRKPKPAAKSLSKKKIARKATRPSAPSAKDPKKTAKAAKRKKEKGFYAETERALLEKLGELDERIREKLNEHMSMHGNRIADTTDQASELADDEFALQIAEVETTERVQIQDALAKVREGNYGLCERCGCRIPIARLKALPFASMCVRCKELEEEFGPDYFLDDDATMPDGVR